MTRMNNRPPNRELERVTYWEGQMLRSSDFLDIQRVEAERRWWHNRAMHNAFGVYQGFQVTEISAADGTREGVQVTPGVAYDCFGRELFLECLATIRYPSQELTNGAARTLVVRHKNPASRRATDAIAAVCCFCDGRSSSGNIEFVWIDNGNISPKEGVPVGTLRGVGTRVIFSQYILPKKRALARPHLATGSTIAGNTPWQPWDYSPPPAIVIEGPPINFDIGIGVQSTIDTSAAGFTELPQYFAWLEGPIFNSQTLQFVPALLPSLANESLNSFTFRLILMKEQQAPGGVVLLSHTIGQRLQMIQDSGSFADFAQQQGLYVSWLGCQMPANAGATPAEKIKCKTRFQAGYERRIR